LLYFKIRRQEKNCKMKCVESDPGGHGCGWVTEGNLQDLAQYFSLLTTVILKLPFK